VSVALKPRSEGRERINRARYMGVNILRGGDGEYLGPVYKKKQ
jgi:hypothetical protein